MFNINIGDIFIDNKNNIYRIVYINEESLKESNYYTSITVEYLNKINKYVKGNISPNWFKTQELKYVGNDINMVRILYSKEETNET